MTSFRRFSAEELAALEPWRLPSVGDGAEPGEEGEEAAQGSEWDEADLPAIPTAEEIEAIQRAAYDEGRADGYGAGSAQGYAEGREQGYAEGRAQGLADGLAEGRAAGQEALRPIAEQVNAVLELLAEPLSTLDDQLETELLELVLACARQLIRRELQTQPGEIIALVREAVGALPAAARKVALHLHPEDADLVRTGLLSDDSAPRWKLVEDPKISRGGCIVKAESSQVDATLEKRIAAMATRLWGGQREGDAS